MKGKIGLLVGLAAGYVLGSRAGRERYEQIRATAKNFWESPTVQDRVESVKDFACSRVVSVTDRVFDGAKSVIGSAVRSVGVTEDDVDDFTSKVKQNLAKSVDVARNLGESAAGRLDSVIDNVAGIAKSSAKPAVKPTIKSSKSK